MLSTTLQEGLSEYAIGDQDPRAAAEEEDGAGRAGAAHRPVAGAAVEDRARPAVPDAADAAAHRAGVQRRARVLLRGVARQAADRGRAQARSCAVCPIGPARATSPTASNRSTIRRASGASTPTRRVPAGRRRKSCSRTITPASSSSTRCKARSPSTSTVDEHVLAPEIRSTSTPRSHTRIAAAPAGSARPSSSPRRKRTGRVALEVLANWARRGNAVESESLMAFGVDCDTECHLDSFATFLKSSVVPKWLPPKRSRARCLDRAAVKRRCSCTHNVSLRWSRPAPAPPPCRPPVPHACRRRPPDVPQARAHQC